ncbi:MAG: hypothetical protein ACE5G1_01705, partial [bacterium]
AYKVLDYIDSRISADVATKKDIYELKLEIEKIRSELEVKIEKVRAEIQKARTDVLKWTFGFWVTQMVVLVGILFKLLS